MSEVQAENPAVTIDQFGAAQLLHFRTDWARPLCKEGEVIIENQFAGINPIDCKTRAGLGWAAEKIADQLPAVLGFDFAGKVVESKDARFSVGQRICALDFSGGAYARYAAINADLVANVPDNVPLDMAGALPCAGSTAWQLIEQAQIQPQEHIVINAPAGGVGHIALQLLGSTGAQITVICSPDKYEYVKTEVPDAEWINYQINDRFPALNADLLLDLVGGEAGKKALNTLRHDARAICLPSIHVPALKEAGRAKGIGVEAFIVDPSAETLNTLLSRLADHTLRLHIDRKYPLREASAAHLELERGRTHGKIVLDIANEV